MSKPPTLPQPLINRISEYGFARTDGASELERINRWMLLIDAIKDYAAEYAAQQAKEQANVPPSMALASSDPEAHRQALIDHEDQAEEITEQVLATAIRKWFPDRANQADYFAAAIFGHPKTAHQEHIAASQDSAKEAKADLAAETPIQKGMRASLAVQAFGKAFEGLGAGRKDKK